MYKYTKYLFYKVYIWVLPEINIFVKHKTKQTYCRTTGAPPTVRSLSTTLTTRVSGVSANTIHINDTDNEQQRHSSDTCGGAGRRENTAATGGSRPANCLGTLRLPTTHDRKP